MKRRTLEPTQKKIDPQKARRSRNFNDDGTPLSGLDTIKRIAEETDTVLMSFSRGKDSLIAWLAIRPYFKNIIPYHLWLVPGLSFVDESLRYYEDFFQTKIISLPHPSFWRMINGFIWQPQERLLTIEAAGIPNYDYDQLNQVLIKQNNLPKNTFVCSGVRAADSPMRRSAINQYGSINWKRRYFYPVWDVNKAGLINAITTSGVQLPVDYELFGRSFDGVDYRFLTPLREHLPDDFQKVLDWFPLARLEIMRYEGMLK